MKRAAMPAILAAVMLLAVAVIAEAQQPKKVPRIGYLSGIDPASESTRFEPIRLALRELGYIEGQTIAIEYRYAEGMRDRYPEDIRLLHFQVSDCENSAHGSTGLTTNGCQTLQIKRLAVRPEPGRRAPKGFSRSPVFSTPRRRLIPNQDPQIKSETLNPLFQSELFLIF